MLKIGPHEIAVPVIVAPMAGMTDLPFRERCRALGAGYAVGEMTASKPELRLTKKSQTRWACEGESGLKVVQLLGADPVMMADAAKFAADSGADVIDINMGCPAKKVLKAACGSALMRNEPLIKEIVSAVVKAVDLPVTLKIRTGWDAEHRNAVSVAQIAQGEGIQCLTIHGRTREQRFTGVAEYDTIAQVKSQVQIPVIANGDIDSGEKAKQVMAYTQADGVMIGRACYGNPWIFGQVAHALGYLPDWQPPTLDDRKCTILQHLHHHVAYYGENELRQFRKHLRYYLAPLDPDPELLDQAFALTTENDVAHWIERFFEITQ